MFNGFMFLNIKFVLYFILLNIFSINAFAISSKDYIPSVSDINGHIIDEVDFLFDTIKSITPMRSGGSKIFETIAPSTVLIKTSKGGIGSGILINKEGDIITNYHVVENTYNSSFNRNFNVIFCTTDSKNISTSKTYVAKTIKVDPKRDLALLRLNSLPNNQVNIPAKIDFSKVSVGMEVHAIGHPEFNECSYSFGYISQIRQDHKWGPYEDGNIIMRATVIQHQTPIHQGNSGGPLINNEGVIIGINTFGHSQASGINYAVAANEIIDFIDNAPLLKFNPNSNKNNEWITKKKNNKWITKKNWITTKCADDYLTAEDLNSNSINETFGFDIDCNGEIDLFKVDIDEDGIFDLMAIDKNANGVYELIISFDIHEEGKYKGLEFATFLYDLDEDGEEDKVCFDVDMDQEIDQCREIS